MSETWVPVSERLPIGAVLVYLPRSKRRIVAWYSDEHAEWQRRGDDAWPESLPEAPTYWMPLPDPPEEPDHA